MSPRVPPNSGYNVPEGYPQPDGSNSGDSSDPSTTTTTRPQGQQGFPVNQRVIGGAALVALAILIMGGS